MSAMWVWSDNAAVAWAWSSVYLYQRYGRTVPSDLELVFFWN